MENNKQILEQEIKKIITSCKIISNLPPQSIITENNFYKPYIPISNRLINTKLAIDIAIQQLDHAYNVCPLNEDKSFMRSLSDIRIEVEQMSNYITGLYESH